VSGRLEGKTAIVTGATEGIGEAITRTFVREGAQVVAVARRTEPGETLAAELGAKVLFVAGDVGDPDTADLVVAAALRQFGALDILINNAALDLSSVPLLETTQEQARRVFDVNALGALWMLLACGRVMAKRGGGSIVNITSRLSLVGLEGSAVYGATKGALLALTRGAAVEWAQFDVRVNAVAPGLTETPMIRTWIEGQDDPLAFRRRREDAIPQHRFARPDEIALATLYLASEESSAITGASLSVDGGYTAA
jgi:NAD(P)-dependent dehydrogenase (short-subunit alcohol dehydrogenase family)